MVLELSFSLRHNISPGDPERADKPEKKEDDLNSADDREPCEKPHVASNLKKVLKRPTKRNAKLTQLILSDQVLLASRVILVITLWSVSKNTEICAG